MSSWVTDVIREPRTLAMTNVMQTPDDPFGDEPTLDFIEAELPANSGYPCLTILAHPEPIRIGERCMLEDLRVGRSVTVARLQPTFAPPTGGLARPLLDPFMSRSGITLRPTRDHEAIVLDPCQRDVSVDGEPVLSELRIQRSRLHRGVLLRLSARIALMLHDGVESFAPSDGRLIGYSPAIDRVRRQITLAAQRDVPVLILGETGTGKELVAEQIHQQSRRADSAFVAVNMATLTPSTAASQLFGHRRGAFTGAEQRHIGLFERAHGGTLLLDELGDAPESVQPMLLRALETGRVLPLGDERERAVDVRVLGATERFPSFSGAVHGMRASLVHRLAGGTVEIAPLRERIDDIPRLLVHFLATLDPDGNWSEGSVRDRESRIGADFVLALVRHPFHGNVRELRNVVLGMNSRELGRRYLPLDCRWSANPAATDLPPPEAKPSTRTRDPARLDDELLAHTLEAHGWSPARAAQALGIPNSTVHYLMRKSGRIRRAIDLEDADIMVARMRTGGEIDAMARELAVSTRALRIRLGRRPRN